MSGQQNDSNSRRGGQGTVQAGHLHGELVACKSIPLKSKRAIAAETCSARRIGQVHPHIVGIKQCEKTATHIQMYMELAMCDLHDFQGCTKSPRLGEAVYVREWGLQLADALRVSHSRGVAHRDVKPENVLLCPHPECESIYPPMQPPCVAGGSVSQVAVYQHRKAQLQELAGNAAVTPHALRAFTAKLCDFGAALVNTGGPGAPAVGVTPRGTSRFCSPQVMSGLLNRGIAPGLTTLWAPVVHPDIVRTCAASYDAYAADVWSFGVTLFALAAGGEPFQAAGPQCAEFRAFVRATQPEALCDEVMCPLSDVWRTDSASSDTSAPWAWPSCFSPALVHLLGGCLRVREGERLSMEEVVAHPWFKNPAWTPLTHAQASLHSACFAEGEHCLSLQQLETIGAAAHERADAADLECSHAAGMWEHAPSSQNTTEEFVLEPGVVSLFSPGASAHGGPELMPIVRSAHPPLQPLRLPPSSEARSATTAGSAAQSSTANPQPCTTGAASHGPCNTGLSSEDAMPSLDTAASGHDSLFGGGSKVWRPQPPPGKAALQSPNAHRLRAARLLAVAPASPADGTSHAAVGCEAIKLRCPQASINEPTQQLAAAQD